MNFIRKFMGNSATDEISSITKGKFFLTRSPHSPKGSLECLYNDALVSISKTTRPFLYQLTISKVYQEGEINDSNENEFGESDDELEGNENLTNQSKDEWSFVNLPDLSFQFTDKSDGSKAISWIDLNGDTGDRFEFVIDDEVKNSEIDQFSISLFSCLYESKYHKEPTTTDDLKEFEVTEDELTFDEFRNDLLKYNNSKVVLEPIDDKEPEDEGEEEGDEGEEEEQAQEEEEEDEDEEQKPQDFVFVEKIDLSLQSVYQDIIDLYVFDTEGAKFVGTAIVSLRTVKQFDYALRLEGKNIKFDSVLGETLTPSFDAIKSCFVFNHVTSNQGVLVCSTWITVFKDLLRFSDFQHKFSQCYYEYTKQKKWITEDDQLDQELLLDSLSNMSISDDEQFLSADEGDEDQSEDEEEEQVYKPKRSQFKPFGDQDKSVHNSGLSVGYANDRSYVVRGNNLGVFKNAGESLEFQTTISNLHDKKGKKIDPRKLMLQNRDQTMIIKGKDDTKIFQMDLERASVVEEWDVSEGVRGFNPNKKLDQLTAEQTFTGVSSQALFRVDPRIAGAIVKEDKQQYKVNNKFNNVVTTESGQMAVSSDKGDIRLYDRLGVRPKTLLPSFGDSGGLIDIANDGRWLLETFKNYILLVDLKIGKGQRNEGQLGFDKPFNLDSKPSPKRLALKPEHAAAIMNATGTKELNFTKAVFNTSDTKNPETRIITSVGNYVVLFNLSNVLKNKEPKYLVKKFTDQVISSDFQFSSDNAIIASENDLSILSKMRFRQLRSNK